MSFHSSSRAVFVSACAAACLFRFAAAPLAANASANADEPPLSESLRDLDAGEFADLLEQAPSAVDRATSAAGTRAPTVIAVPTDLPAIPEPVFDSLPQAFPIYMLPLAPLEPGAGRLDPERAFSR